MIQEKFLTDVCVSNRQQIGERIGVIGITVNSFLFAIKLTLGLLNNSVSVIADGFNNLGDSVSSLVTTIGFHLSGKPQMKNILTVMEGWSISVVLL